MKHSFIEDNGIFFLKHIYMINANDSINSISNIISQYKRINLSKLTILGINTIMS